MYQKNHILHPVIAEQNLHNTLFSKDIVGNVRKRELYAQ